MLFYCCCAEPVQEVYNFFKEVTKDLQMLIKRPKKLLAMKLAIERGTI